MRKVNFMANNFPDQRTVKQVRKMYPRGTRVELIRMDDPYSLLKPGDKGTVRLVDDTATVFVDWDLPCAILVFALVLTAAVKCFGKKM